MAQTATVQIEMPEMGESVTEGIVLEWHVAEGAVRDLRTGRSRTERYDALVLSPGAAPIRPRASSPSP